MGTKDEEMGDEEPPAPPWGFVPDVRIQNELGTPLMTKESQTCSILFARLELRLEDWFQGVDQRLDRLFDLHSNRTDPRAKRRTSTLTPVSTVNPAMWSKRYHAVPPPPTGSGSHDLECLCSSVDMGATTPTPSLPTRERITKFKAQIDAVRRLNSHHLGKETMDKVRQSDLNVVFLNRCEAVETALKKSNGRCTLERLVLHDLFDFFISAIVVLNAFLIGFEVEWDAQGHGPSQALQILEWFCAAIFAFELLLRILGRGKDLFLLKGERAWAVCDVILVTFSVLHVIFMFLPGMSTGMGESVTEMGASGRLLKIMRMLRIMRLLRMVRFLSELRVMAHMIHHSLMSLFWLFTLLTILIYIFSIVLTQGAADHLRANTGDWFIRKHYGSLFTTMYTLFQAMSGGLNWGEVTTPLLRVGQFYFAFSLVFVFFSIFSVLNIVTGVFVDGAIELAKQDRYMVVAKNVQARDASALHLLELLREMDTDGDDTLNYEEFTTSMARKDVVEYLEALSVDATEAELLFMLLDKDGDGCVDIEEFVTGMQRLQGDAKSFDVHLLMHANRDLQCSCKQVLSDISVRAPARASLQTDEKAGGPKASASL